MPETTPSKTLRMDELNDAQFEKAMLTGELPERDAAAVDDPAAKKADTPAEAAAAEVAEQPASTEAKAEPPAKEAAPAAAKPEKVKGQKKSARERAAEINAEAATEEQELAKALERRARARDARREAEREEPPAKRAESDGKQPPASKEPAEPTYKQYRAMPDAPKSKDFEDLDDYVAAMGVFIADKRAEAIADRKLSEREQQWGSDAQFQRELDAQTEQSFARAKAEVEADPEIVSRIDKRWIAVETKHPSDASCTPIEFIKANVALYARKPLAVAAYFATEDGMKELTALCRMPKERIVRELPYIDARFDAATDPDQDEPEATRPSRVSKAPAPSPTLGKKPSPGKDPLKTAIDENDFETFNRLESERERAVSAR